MRVVSLLPSTTEIVVALGHGDDLVGITHECDYPAGLAGRVPAVTSDMLASGLTSAEIDEAVRASVSDAHTVYALDAEALRNLEPRLVLSQSLCEVCAVSADAVAAAVCSMPHEAEVLGVDPGDLDAVIDSISVVAQALGDAEAGDRLTAELRDRLNRVARLVEGRPRPRVAVLEWPVPPFAPGHWVPDMVTAAGGENLLGRSGEPSTPVEWSAILAAAPEVVVLAFCGFDASETVRRADEFGAEPAWLDLLASPQLSDVVVVDGSGLFSRPGPRVVDGVEVLAQLLHGPDLGGSVIAPGTAFRLIDQHWVEV